MQTNKMTDKFKPPNQRGIEAVRLHFDINRASFNVVDEPIGIRGTLQVTNIDNTITTYNILKTANYIGFNEWTLELFVPPNSVFDYRACLVRPSRSKVSDYQNTKGLYKPPDVASFKNHPWLNPSEKLRNRPADEPMEVYHTEECALRKLVVAEKSLRIDLSYGKENVKVTEMRSQLTGNGDPLKIRVALPKDKGYYEPDNRHITDIDYKDNTIPDERLYFVKLAAAYNTIHHTIIEPEDPLATAKPTDVGPVINKKTLRSTDTTNAQPETIVTPPTSGTKLPSSFSFWNVAKYGLPVLGIGLAAALYYKCK
ncbi:hypothetical protein ACF0H5_009882 [Mactra antiquata]